MKRERKSGKRECSEQAMCGRGEGCIKHWLKLENNQKQQKQLYRYAFKGN